MNKVFLPFLTALSAEFGRVEETPESNKVRRISRQKKHEKAAEKGGSIPSRIKEYAAAGVNLRKHRTATPFEGF